MVSVAATVVRSVSSTPDLRLSTSRLDTVLLSALIVLLVRVCVPVRVATVLSILKVTLLPEPTVSMPVPPVSVRLSLSRSIDNAPPVSAEKSRSWAVTWLSTYALIDCCVASAVALSDDIVSSSRISVTVVVGIAMLSTYATPSIYRSLNSAPDAPKSTSLSVTGTMTPSWKRTCSVDTEATSTKTPTRLLVSSTTTLLIGVVTPGSPINPMTGPSAAVPSCL